jgi:MFS family permease
MVLYAETMLIPAIPQLIDEFGITYSTSSWILSSYLISGAISVPIAGKLSDLYGRKKVLLIIMIIYFAGVTGGSISNDIYSMVFSRTVQGIGMAVFPIVFAIVQDQFPKNKIALAQGTLASMFAFGGVLGLVVGGHVIEYFGWRATFYTVIPISVILLATIHRYIQVRDRIGTVQSNSVTEITVNSLAKDNKHPSGFSSRMDIKGTMFLAVTIIAFLSSMTLLRTSESPTAAADPGIHIGFTFIILISVGFAALATFIIVERKSRFPLIDLKLISRNPIWITNTVVIIWGICTFAIFQSLPVLVQNPPPFGMGGTSIDAANIQLPFSISSLAFGPTSGWIISRIGSTKAIRIGAFILTIGLSGMLIFHDNAIKIAINLAIVGTGLSLLNVGQLNITTTSIPMASIGASLGTNTLLRYIGAAIGPTIAGMIMQHNLILSQSPNSIMRTFPSMQSYGYIFLFIFLLSIITIILSFLIKKQSRDRLGNQQEKKIKRLADSNKCFSNQLNDSSNQP